MDDQKLTDIVNQSGFPLQVAVASLVERTQGQHGWRELFREHSWRSDREDGSGFIDLVLANRHGTSVMVVECKRVLETSWIFLDPDRPITPRRHAKAWITRYTSNTFKHAGWADIAIDPVSKEAEFCVIPGQDARSRPMLERTAAELISATEALAIEEMEYQSQLREALRMYFSVIVTTATLRVCRFEPDRVSLADGKVVDADFVEVPFIRFRKQLTTGPSSRPLNVQEGPPAYARNKEHTVFVVNVEALPDFLADFDVDNESIRRF